MKRIITFNQLGRYGRFANQLYQIAGTIGIARKNGYEFAFPYWKNYDHADRFGSAEDIDLQKYFINPLPVYQGPVLPEWFVHWGYHDIKLTQSCSLSGHMQSFKYFEHCFDEVKWYFRMKDEPKPNDYCAIHVRLGDYDGGYHPRLGIEYYAAAIEHFDRGQKFLLFSDDPAVAIKMLADYKQRIIPAPNADYIQHFKLMKLCRHFIIGNSSYSAMAAVLGEAPDKKVIAPDPWFGPKYTDITGKDIYNREWTVINYQNLKVTA